MYKKKNLLEVLFCQSHMPTQKSLVKISYIESVDMPYKLLLINQHTLWKFIKEKYNQF